MKALDPWCLDGHKGLVRKPVSMTRLLQIALMVVSLCALIFSPASSVHASMNHHGSAFVAEAADGHAAMDHAAGGSAACTSSEQSGSLTDDGFNCCSAMCSAAFLVEAVIPATSGQRGAHFALPLQALTSRETHGLIRPPSI
ncbi:MAG: hypothetical protein KDK29_02465 [Sedimentitalea sp.]|nr:hypothetical protein [Sedimentitalea sp.]